MNKLTCLAAASFCVLSIASCGGGNQDQTSKMTNTDGKSITVLNSLYKVQENSNSKRLLASYKDNNYWYYSYDLGTMYFVPFEAANHWRHYKTTPQTVNFKIARSTETEVTTTATRLISTSSKLSTELSASVKTKAGAKAAGASASVEAGISYKVGAESTSEVAFEESYKKFVAEKETSEFSTSITFTENTQEGYWYYLHTANLQVYGTIVYDPVLKESYYRFDSEVISEGYELYYAGDSGIMPNRADKEFVFDADLDFNNMKEPDRFVGVELSGYSKEYRGGGSWNESRTLDHPSEIHYDWDLTDEAETLEKYQRFGYTDIDIDWSCQVKSDNALFGWKAELYFEIANTRSTYFVNSRLPAEGFYYPDYDSGNKYSGHFTGTIKSFLETKLLRINVGNKSNTTAGFVWNMGVTLTIHPKK